MNKMIGTWVVVLLVSLAGGSTGEARTVDTSCRDPWQSTSLCAYDDDPSVTEKGVSEADIVEILAEHNKYRAAVNPPAKKMMKLYWSEELEMLAQKYVQTCRANWGKAHDYNGYRKVPSWNGMQIGQNAASRSWTRSWAEAIRGWHNELRFFTHGKYNDFREVGHYTQVVRDVSFLVGCGFARCGTMYQFICNYAYMNNINHPYVQGGSPCEGCPGHCSNNLCDCNGLRCVKGTLNLSTCKCDCESKLWAGEDCGTMDLGQCRDDPVECDYWPVIDCKHREAQLPCPQKCGICKPDCDVGCVRGHQDPDTCVCTCSSKLFKGDDCSEVETSLCKDPSYCEHYDCGVSVEWDECPAKCGVCTPPG